MQQLGVLTCPIILQQKKDLIRNHWLLVPLLHRWPARVPPAGVVKDALVHLCQLIDATSVVDGMWAHQQTIIVQRLVVKLRRLKRRSPRSRNNILAMLKQMVMPSRPTKDSHEVQVLCFFHVLQTLLIHDLHQAIAIEHFLCNMKCHRCLPMCRSWKRVSILVNVKKAL